jgi:D-cysteine desulfhydrase
VSGLPLAARFPALATLPRARLGCFPSPVERLDLGGGRELWIKRDDLNAPVCGGNKVRALEFLLGTVRPADVVLTLGGEGSTHVLATAVHAARLGARTIALRWTHDMNDAARSVAVAARERCAEVVTARTAAGAVARAYLLRLTRRVHYVPIGGSTPLGVLGHVNAALELAGQVAGGEMPAPARVVVPLGSGGTAAGLALGFAIAGLRTTVVAARVAPRVVSNRAHVLRLARATARFIERSAGTRLPAVPRAGLVVAHHAYGGAYGRPLAAGDAAASALRRARGVALDATYSAKAGAVALDSARDAGGPTLFWLTFDGRALRDGR